MIMSLAEAGGWLQRFNATRPKGKEAVLVVFGHRGIITTLCDGACQEVFFHWRSPEKSKDVLRNAEPSDAPDWKPYCNADKIVREYELVDRCIESSPAGS